MGVHACGCRVYRKPYTGKLTVQRIMAEENASVRLAMMHACGLDRFLLDAGAKVISEEAGYQLLDLVTDRSSRWWVVGRIRALRMTCPSISATYINTVPPNVSNVCEATNWMFNTSNYLERVGVHA